MTDGTPEDLPDEELPDEAVIAADELDPEEYEPDGTTRAVSAATGTEYDETGAPAATPGDASAAAEEDPL